MKILFLLGILLTMLFSVNAQSIPVAISIPDEKLDLSTKAVQKNIQINGLLRVDGYVPILRAKIYFKSSSAGGWNPGVILKLNGKSFSARTSANHSRLLRRGEFFYYRIKEKEGKLPYFIEGRMYGMIGSGKENDVDKRIIYSREDGFRYYFDISDLVKYGKEEKNILTLGTTVTLKLMGGKNRALCFQNMKIMYVKESELSQLRK